MRTLIEIVTDESSKEGYICEPIEEHDPRYRRFKSIEDVRNNCPQQVVDILERDGHCLENCSGC